METNLFYDPYIYGYNSSFFKTILGEITVVNGKIRVNSSSTNSSFMFMFGDLTYKVKIPTIPTAGDSRIWGFYSRASQNRNFAYFFISGTNFYVRSHNDSSTTSESTTIAWEDAWTNTEIDFKIRWRIDRVEFWINGRRMATHYEEVPTQVLAPMYISNTGSDDMDIGAIELLNAKKTFNNKVSL